jgi:hypothetical protein
VINMGIGAAIAGLFLLLGATLLTSGEPDRSLARRLFCVPAFCFVLSAVGFVGAANGY